MNVTRNLKLSLWVSLAAVRMIEERKAKQKNDTNTMNNFVPTGGDA